MSKLKVISAVCIVLFLLVNIVSAGGFWTTGVDALRGAYCHLTGCTIDGPVTINRNLTVEENILVGTGTEWLSIYLEGTTGYFNSTYPIRFTGNINVNNITLEGTSADTCTATETGTIVYNSSTNKFLGCNSSAWVVLG